MEHYIGALAFGFALVVLNTYRRRARNPPGPTPLPIIGNVLDMPRSFPWEAYMKWGEKYGTVYDTTTTPHQTVILFPR